MRNDIFHLFYSLIINFNVKIVQYTNFSSQNHSSYTLKTLRFPRLHSHDLFLSLGYPIFPFIWYRGKGFVLWKKLPNFDTKYYTFDIFPSRRFSLWDICTSPANQVWTWGLKLAFRRWNVRWYRWLRNWAWSCWWRCLISETPRS